MSPRVTLITVYHPGADENLLIESLRATVSQLDSRGHLVLVANGSKELRPELAPDRVVRAIGGLARCRISPVMVPCNRGGAPGLNAGVVAALQEGEAPDWIGQVQSSVVLDNDWLRHLLADSSEGADARFGPLYSQESPDATKKPWANGHLLRATRTTMNPAAAQSAFPCLSACLVRRHSVEAVVKMYGSFVFDRVHHYGDCLDAGLRLHSVGATFALNHQATARKRARPWDQTGLLCARLMAARLYYPDRWKGVWIDALRRGLGRRRWVAFDCAATRLRNGPYSALRPNAPTATLVRQR